MIQVSPGRASVHASTVTHSKRRLFISKLRIEGDFSHGDTIGVDDDLLRLAGTLQSEGVVEVINFNRVFTPLAVFILHSDLEIEDKWRVVLFLTTKDGLLDLESQDAGVGKMLLCHLQLWVAGTIEPLIKEMAQ